MSADTPISWGAVFSSLVMTFLRNTSKAPNVVAVAFEHGRVLGFAHAMETAEAIPVERISEILSLADKAASQRIAELTSATDTGKAELH
ncbi:MAG: hypothetical protein IPK65_12840 [Gammaproteobacteria bacterium]|nr:hypothetical protein [Gammaproteobacteria bacterium]